MNNAASRMAAQIARELGYAWKDDKDYARKIARFLLGESPKAPPLHDEVIVDGVVRLLRHHGYRPGPNGGPPWRSTVL